ncbi:MAG: hypothetical protein HC849_17010 [Oscillatoriales cyanobacterium RU_3_3]|nr:hypothetical protein [Oscillatoriales cyanobacterium RU_3_3]
MLKALVLSMKKSAIDLYMTEDRSLLIEKWELRAIAVFTANYFGFVQ